MRTKFHSRQSAARAKGVRGAGAPSSQGLPTIMSMSKRLAVRGMTHGLCAPTIPSSGSKSFIFRSSLRIGRIRKDSLIALTLRTTSRKTHRKSPNFWLQTKQSLAVSASQAIYYLKSSKCLDIFHLPCND